MSTPEDDFRDYCPSCGARVSGTSVFCSSCGEPLNDPPTQRMRPISPPMSSVTTPRAGGQRANTSDVGVAVAFALGLALILVLVGVALFVGGVFNSSNPPS